MTTTTSLPQLVRIVAGGGALLLTGLATLAWLGLALSTGGDWTLSIVIVVLLVSLFLSCGVLTFSLTRSNGLAQTAAIVIGALVVWLLVDAGDHPSAVVFGIITGAPAVALLLGVTAARCVEDGPLSVVGSRE
ncbi:hypothetical protein [Microlunatus sp. Y2014]|uniref:hypothetical protein n=1 Tax=Microlunatus sp. Y2014 TaxID=3418488 RepID=UPI003DA786A1